MDLIYRVAGGSIAAFIITVLLLKFLPGEKALLGHDRGRLYAQGSAVNIGIIVPVMRIFISMLRRLRSRSFLSH